MKLIPNSYRKYGYTFDLVERTPFAAIYSQSRNGKTFAFEVVRVRSRGESVRVLGGVEVKSEAGEYLPTEKEWGTHAKTVPDLATAKARIDVFKPTPRSNAAHPSEEPAEDFDPDGTEDLSALPPDHT